ncbi:MAG: type II toxin-antitoxin system prevent-host-death family antitoxin [Thiotrichaceae bacterium]|nr:type II toxin-antitoxin system prevent-host-death family antitoxin [Thiotrichaceae bacterium]
MEVLNASDAKREFGEVLLKAQKSPVKINKNGKPVAVVVSATDFAELESLREAYLKSEIKAGIADVEAGNVLDASVVMEKLRKRTV